MASFIEPPLKDLLSKYFSNFDASKIDFGIKANVTLADLHLRTDVLDQFNLPFRVIGGRVGQLYVDIGFGGLFNLARGSTAVVDVKLTDVYILAVPPSSLPYDQEKAEAAELEKKRGALKSLGDKQKAVLEAEEPAAGGGFFDNMILGIMNNVKVVVENIHIRYEDDKLKPGSPFSFGVVLPGLTAQTCSKDWVVDKIGLEPTFFKIVELTSYGFYWNSNEKNLISANKDTSDKSLQAIVKEMAAVMNENKMDYAIGPLNTKVKAKVTLYPEKLPDPFSLPKAIVEVELPELTIGLSNDQFSEALTLAESFEVMQRAMPYRKYRPFNTPVEGHAKEWWSFVYNSAMVEAKRRRFTAIWDNYKNHRKLVKKYTEIYPKIARKTATKNEIAEAQKLEDQLDNISIMLARKQTDLIVNREQKMIKANTGHFIFSSWYVLTEDDKKEIMTRGLSDEEKAAFAALKEENSKPVEYPSDKDYVEIQGYVNITQTVLNIANRVQAKAKEEHVMKLVINSFSVSGETHPIKNGFQVDASMKTILITGLEQDGIPKPELLKSITDEHTQFFKLTYQKNPFDSNLGQKVKFSSERSDVIYHAVTVQKLIDTFKWPEHVELSQTSASVSSTIQNLKKSSIEGMQDLVNDTSAIGVDIKVTAPRIIVPQNGELSDTSTALIINLGTLTMKSVDHTSGETPDLKALTEGSPDQNVNPELEKLIYNEYQVQLKDFEVLMALESEKLNMTGTWDKARTGEPAAILNKVHLVVDLGQAKITNDQRFPKLKVGVQIPLLEVDITETRMFKLMSLALTFPIPVMGPSKSRVVDVRADPNANYKAELEKFMKSIEQTGEQPKELKKTVITDDFDPANAPQLTNVLCHAEIKGIKVLVSKLVNDKLVPALNLLVGEIDASVHMKVYGTKVDAALKGLSITYGEAQIRGTDGPVYLLETPVKESEPLVRVTLFMMNDDCPRKPSGSTKQDIDVKINQLNLILHQEAIRGLLVAVDRVTAELDRIKEEKAAKQIAIQDVLKLDDAGEIQVSGKKVGVTKPKERGDLDMRVRVVLASFSLQLTSEAKSIAKIGIETMSVTFEDGWVSQVVNVTLSQLEIADLDPSAKYTKFLKVKDIGVGTSDALTFRLDKYKDLSSRKEFDPDMNIVFDLGGLRIIATGTFLGNVMNFVNNFHKVKKAIAEASANASKKSIEAVKEALMDEKNASKIGLSIKVGAPEIYVAKEESSNEVLAIILGELKLNNTLSGKTTSDPNKNAIVDTDTIVLSGAWLGRGLISNDGELIAQSSYLDPITIQFDVIRNLSSWYKELPQFTLDLELGEIMGRAAVDDVLFPIECILQILKGMAAVKTPPPLKTQKMTLGDGPLQVLGDNPEVKAPTKSRLCSFKAKVNKIGAAIYSKKTSLEGKTGTVPRDPTTAISEILLENISCNAEVWTNMNLTAKLELGNVVIEDKRAEASITADFIQKKVKSGGGPMVAVRFSQTLQPNGDKLMDAGLDTTGAEFVLNFDFIHDIVEIINRGKEVIPKLIDELKKSQKALSGEPDGIQAVGSAASEKTALIMVNAKVKIDEMNVLVLEDINTLDTNAIEFTIAGKFDAEVSIGADTKTHGSGAIKLGLATTNYKTRAEKKLAQIIRPAEFKITVDMTPEMKLDVGVELPELSLKFSAGTIFLFAKIGGSAVKSFSSRDEGPPPEKDYSDIWQVKQNSDEDFWFLKPELTDGRATQVVIITGGVEDIGNTRKVEQRVKINVFSIAVSLEAGSGSMTTPLIIIDGSLDAEVTNFSSDLLATGNLRLSAAYNNTNIGVWEYLLEPVEIRNAYRDSTFKPWELKFSASKPAAIVGEPVAPMKVNVFSEEPLEITVSKTGMAALRKIGASFAESATTSTISDEEVKSTPYTFQNGVGVPLSIRIDESSPFVYLKNDVAQYGDINVAPGEKLDLGLNLHITASSANTGAPAERILSISIPEFQINENVNVGQNQARFFSINRTSSSGEPQGIVIDVASDGFTIAVTARSLVAIISEVDIPLDIYGGNKTLIGTVEPLGYFSVPLNDVYANPAGFFLKPRGFELSPVPMPWSSLKTVPRMRWVPSSMDESGRGEQVNFWAIGEQKPSFHANTGFLTSSPQNFVFTIRSQVIINNLLPIPLIFTVGRGTQFNIESGRTIRPVVLPHNPNKAYDFNLILPNFRGQPWFSDVVHLSYGNDTITKLIFRTQDQGQSVCFGYMTDGKPYDPAVPANKTIDPTSIHIFCPYWMVNHTGLNLAYKSEGGSNTLRHAPEEAGPVLFCPERSLSHEAQFSCEGSPFSQPIPLDASTGVPTPIHVTVQRRVYELTVSSVLSQCGLGRIVTITSKYNIVNSTPHPLIVAETDVDPSAAVRVPPLQSIPYWPLGQVCRVRVNVEGTSEFTRDISYNETNNAMLKLGNKYGALRANVTKGATSTSIRFSDYNPIEVPVLVVNDTKTLRIAFRQSGEPPSNNKFVDAGQSLIYAWDNLKSHQSLHWSVNGGAEMKLDVSADAEGELHLGPTKKCKWISFTKYLRRVLLLTENFPLVNAIKKLDAGSDEKQSVEVNISLMGIGISFLNNVTGKDFLYTRIGGMGPMWEYSAPGKGLFKLLPQDENALLEAAIQSYSRGQLQSPQLRQDIQVDFGKNMIYRSSGAADLARRQERPALLVGIQIFPTKLSVDLQVNNIQIDNQIAGAKQPILFNMAPMEHTAKTPTEVQPPLLSIKFAKVSTPDGILDLYFGAIILQEFDIRADLTVANAGSDFMKKDEGHQAKQFYNDYIVDYKTANMTNEEFYAAQYAKSASDKKVTIFEQITISNLKFKLTFSLAGADTGPFSSVFMGLGAALVNPEDEPMNISGSTMQHMRQTPSEFMDTLFGHYKSSIISAAMRLLFNMDLLGNPAKLLGGVGQGLSTLMLDPLDAALKGDLLGGVEAGLKGVGQIFGSATDAVAGSVGAVGRILDGAGLGIAGDVLGIFSGALKTHGKAMSGKVDHHIDKVREPRALVPNAPLKPYSEIAALGQSLKAQLDPHDGGKYVAFFFTGRNMVFLIASRKLYFAELHNNLRKVKTKIFEVNLGQINNVRLERNALIIDGAQQQKTQQSYGLFGSTKPVPVRSAVQPIMINDPEMAQYILGKVQNALQEARMHPQPVAQPQPPAPAPQPPPRRGFSLF